MLPVSCLYLLQFVPRAAVLWLRGACDGMSLFSLESTVAQLCTVSLLFRVFALLFSLLIATADIGNMTQPQATLQQSITIFVEWLCEILAQRDHKHHLECSASVMRCCCGKGKKPGMVSTVWLFELKLSGKLVWNEPTVAPFLLLCRKMALSSTLVCS